MDPRALVKELENIQRDFALEKLLRAGGLDGSSAAFEYGKAAGYMAGIQAVIDKINGVVAEERRKEREP